MSSRELAIAAIKEEAKRNPETKIKIGTRMWTFSEVAEKIESDREAQKVLLEPYVKQLESNPKFRTGVLKLLGREQE